MGPTLRSNLEAFEKQSFSWLFSGWWVYKDSELGAEHRMYFGIRAWCVEVNSLLNLGFLEIRKMRDCLRLTVYVLKEGCRIQRRSGTAAPTCESSTWRRTRVYHEIHKDPVHICRGV